MVRENRFFHKYSRLRAFYDECKRGRTARPRNPALPRSSIFAHNVMVLLRVDPKARLKQE